MWSMIATQRLVRGCPIMPGPISLGRSRFPARCCSCGTGHPAAGAAADDVFTRIATFSARWRLLPSAAYAVLAYVAQEAVNTYGWLRPGQMLDGPALPRRRRDRSSWWSVRGFLAAAACDRPAPLVAATLGAILTDLGDVPPVLPLDIRRCAIRPAARRRALSAALTAITAAVVGVILNLALWFAIHTLFGEVRESGSQAHVQTPVLPLNRPRCCWRRVPHAVFGSRSV